MSGCGTGVLCSEPHPRLSTPETHQRERWSCTAWDTGFLPKDSRVTGKCGINLALDVDSGCAWGLPWRLGPWRATEMAKDMGQRGETISSDQPICTWSSNSPERQGAAAGETAGKHSPKAIYSSYFQTNTQTFMLAVLAAFLKLALIKSVRVCVC